MRASPVMQESLAGPDEPLRLPPTVQVFQKARSGPSHSRNPTHPPGEHRRPPDELCSGGWPRGVTRPGDVYPGFCGKVEALWLF